MTDQSEREISTDDAVAISITKRVLPGREEEFEDVLTAATQQASRHDGFLGARVFRPARGSRDYRVVFRFERESDLRRWQASSEAQAWHELAEQLLDDVPPVVENISGTSQERSLAMALTPLQGYVRASVSGIGMLLVGTALALVMANTMFADSYDKLWSTHLTIGIADWSIDESLRHWVNDALMALFFFILGLEIKREVLVGELRSRRQAAFPIAAAIGGAVVPALIFFLLNIGDSDMRHGWGIPMATDTAFTLGILSLFGGRIRPMLVVFLTAFSIVDDIIAVAVIAVFYTSDIVWPALAVAAILLLVLAVANLAGLHRWPVFAIVGVGVWLAVFESGVHGTLAGVLVAMTVPARSWINPSQFLVRGRELMDEFEAACYATSSILSNEPQQRATQSLEHLCEDVETPMTHLQHSVTPWVVYGILPLFAFANAGISLTEGLSDAFGSAVTWGVVLGLLIGKPVGILLFAWAAVRTGLAIRPGQVTWQHIASVAMLGGIGFTMSLFVTELAFGEGPHAHPARLGILLASIVAGAIGYLALRLTLPPEPAEAGVESPPEATRPGPVLAPGVG